MEYSRAQIEYIRKNGSILIPAYSFAFARGKIYNKLTTPSEVGNFANYLLKRFPKNRSKEPIFSHFVFGKLNLKGSPSFERTSIKGPAG